MTRTDNDVLTIGNAIVDILSLIDDDFLTRENLVKGSMRLIDQEEADRLFDLMGPAQMISGGCAGNTAAGIASFSGRAAFIGKVADDEAGRFYRHDMRALDIAFPTGDLTGGIATGRSMILITPDTERTMNTFLGACQELAPPDIDADTVAGAAITYLEGYLWDPPKAKEAFVEASRIAHDADRQVAITLSDSFCVDRYRDEFLELMRSGKVDIVFANNHEVLSLYQTSDFSGAVNALADDVSLAAVTMGAEGSMVVRGPDRVSVPAPTVDAIVDKTGAGDLFASGFLFGLARGRPDAECAALGSLAAGEILRHVGARPQHSLKAIAEQQGLTL